MTRRGLFSVLPALTALAQDAAQPRTTREQDLESARIAIRANAESLAKVKIPPSTEPAFLFKA